MDTIYVYYKVSAPRGEAVLSAARALLTAVHDATGVSGRLLRRREQPGNWMEVYEGIADLATFDRVLAEKVVAVGFHDHLGSGGRHTERFTPLVRADLTLLPPTC